MSALPRRVIRWGDETVYAPECPECGFDHTSFDEDDVCCGWCGHVWELSCDEAYRIREPQRLEARLAELKAEAAARRRGS